MAAPHRLDELFEWGGGVARPGGGLGARPVFFPGWEQVVEPALIGLAARPAHLAAADRRLVEVGGGPVKRQATAEMPALCNPLVFVEIHHLHDDPFRPRLMLVLGIDDALGMIRI